MLDSIVKANHGAYVEISRPNSSALIALGNIFSIDKVTSTSAIIRLTENNTSLFLSYKIPYIIVPRSSYIGQVKMGMNLKSTQSWDTYPSYNEYLSMIDSFEIKYPSICKVYEIGMSKNNRRILALHISKSVNVNEGEAGFMYSSSIHGDELTGYVLLLRLADYLLKNYFVDTNIQHLIDNMDIWINPLANPDGTYYGGNTTVAGAIRENANLVDLNRNYPDPAAGNHPDGKAWQPENIAMMNFVKDHRIDLSANFHGGTEVLNYPWDTWSRLHSDDSWFRYICHKYADTAQKYGVAGYFSSYDDGITNGYAWYRITGGRQDYMNYFIRSREVTIEISDFKTPDANELPAFWEANYRSLIEYMKQGLTGIYGTVKDSSTNTPIAAIVTVLNHDIDHSEILTDTITGSYRRLIDQGKYDIVYSANGYFSKTISNVILSRDTLINLNIILRIDTTISIKNNSIFSFKVFPNPSNDVLYIKLESPNNLEKTYNITNIWGVSVSSGNFSTNEFQINITNYVQGLYYLSLKQNNNKKTVPFVVTKNNHK